MNHAPLASDPASSFARADTAAAGYAERVEFVIAVATHLHAVSYTHLTLPTN